MDPNTALAVSLVINALVAVGAVLGPWLAKRHEDRVEHRDEGAFRIKLQFLIDQMGEVRADVKHVPGLVQRMATLEDVVAHHVRSDHRELRGEVAKLRDSMHEE